jgi:hypothetical protein
MTRIDLIKSQVAQARESLTQLNTLAETEKRVKTAEERTKFDGLVKDIQSLEAEMKDIEAVERIKIDAPVIITSETKNKTKRYNLGKAIMEFADRRLTGLEAEVQSEMQRIHPNVAGLLAPDELLFKRTENRVETVANTAGLIKVGASGMDIISVPALYEQWGVTVFRDLTVQYKLNWAAGLSTAPVVELQPYTGKSYTKGTHTLSPVAYGYQTVTTVEALAVADMTADMVADANAATGAAITAELLRVILASTGNTMTGGYLTSSSGHTVTSKITGKMQASLLAPLFRKPAYILGGILYNELQQTQGATIARTVIESYPALGGNNGYPQAGILNGFPAFNAMTLMGVHDSTKYDIVFGDMSRAYVGLWGGFQILINPYSLDTTREIRLTFTRLADVTFNPYAWTDIRNVVLAS